MNSTQDTSQSSQKHPKHKLLWQQGVQETKEGKLLLLLLHKDDGCRRKSNYNRSNTKCSKSNIRHPSLRFTACDMYVMIAHWSLSCTLLQVQEGGDGGLKCQWMEQLWRISCVVMDEVMVGSALHHGGYRLFQSSTYILLIVLTINQVNG